MEVHQNNSELTIQERTEQFAIGVINAYTQINKHSHFNDAASVLSKQFLRSGTSIGANCPKGYRFAYAEAVYAQSTKDFIHKYSIALSDALWVKEASESIGYADSTLRSNGGTLQRSLD